MKWANYLFGDSGGDTPATPAFNQTETGEPFKVPVRVEGQAYELLDSARGEGVYGWRPISERIPDQYTQAPQVGPANYYYYSGGGYTPPPPPKWKAGYAVKDAPTWWKGLVPDRFTGATAYAATMNALIPYLSEEDQRTVASNLSRTGGPFKKLYNPEKVNFEKPKSKLSGRDRSYYTSAERAQTILGTLRKMQKAAKKAGAGSAGAGYKYLRHVANVAEDFGGKSSFGRVQTRQQYLQMISALDPLLAEAKSGKLSSYGSAARMITNPYFTAGAVVPVRKDQAGNYVFGKGNKGLY